MKYVLPAILLFAICWLQVRLWVGEGSYAHVAGLAEEVSLEQAENERKRERNKVLKAEILDLRDGLDAVEEKARSEFGLIKRGETFYQIVDQ